MSADVNADKPTHKREPLAPRSYGRMLAVWAMLFFSIGFLLWIGIHFWSPGLRAAVQPNQDMGRAPALPALFPAGSGPIFNMASVVESSSPAEFIGRRVEFSDVTVIGTEGSTFRIRDSEGDALIVASWSSQPPGVATGQRLLVSGLVLNLPSVEIMQEQWRVSAETAARMQQDKIYLRASTIEVR